MMVVYKVPDGLRETTSKTKFTPEELSESAKDMRYSVVFEEWNKYVLEDGMAVRIKSNVVQILRTGEHERNGDPIYIVNTGQLFGLKPREKP